MTEITQDQIEAERDNHAVDQFAADMKNKLAASRSKGRSGWHNPDRCSATFLAGLMIEHLSKENEGTFLDIANFCMMLHQRGESPKVIGYADRLARIEAACLLRSEIDAPEDAEKWVKTPSDTCWYKTRADSGVPAPDYRPNEPGPITLPILEA